MPINKFPVRNVRHWFLYELATTRLPVWYLKEKTHAGILMRIGQIFTRQETFNEITRDQVNSLWAAIEEGGGTGGTTGPVAIEDVVGLLAALAAKADNAALASAVTDLQTSLGLKANATDLASKVSTTDPRLSDARTPLTHTQAIGTILGLTEWLNGLQDQVTNLSTLNADDASSEDLANAIASVLAELPLYLTIDAASTLLDTKADKVDVYTKIEVDTEFDALEASVGDAFGGIFSSLATKASNDQLASEIFGAEARVDDKLDLKADKVTTYTKVEVDSKLASPLYLPESGSIIRPAVVGHNTGTVITPAVGDEYHTFFFRPREEQCSGIKWYTASGTIAETNRIQVCLRAVNQYGKPGVILQQWLDIPTDPGELLTNLTTPAGGFYVSFRNMVGNRSFYTAGGYDPIPYSATSIAFARFPYSYLFSASQGTGNFNSNPEVTEEWRNTSTATAARFIPFYLIAA